MTRILGIEIAGDYGSGPAIKQAVGDLREFDNISRKAAASVEKLAAQRGNLKMLATAYKDVAATAAAGSDEQLIALKKVSDAEARLAAQVKETGAAMVSANRASKESAAGLGAVGTSAKSAHGFVNKLSGSMALWLGAPALGAGLASAIHGTQEFSASMELLHTQAGASQAEVTRMTKAVQGMAASVGTGPAELATGLYHIESAGFRGAKALQILKVAAEGARLGNANLEDVTNALNAAVVSGIDGAQNYTQAMGVLNATVGAGDMRMQDLSDAMGTGLPAKARLMGLSLRDVGAALAVFGDNNIRGAEAGTQLASAIRLLGAPSKASAKELAGLGLSSTQLADDMRSGGIVKAVSDLKTRMDGMGLSASQQAVVLTRAFGGRQAGGILLLINQLDRLKQKEVEVGDGGRKFGENWSAYTKQSQFATQKFQASLETLRIEVGNAILPTFTKATDSLSKWIDKENKSGELAKDMKIGMEDLVAVFKGAKVAIDDVDKVTGGFKQTMELLLGLKVASILSGWSTAFVGVGTQATVAEGEVATLRGSLASLAAINPIVIPITLAVIATKLGQGDPLGLGNISKKHDLVGLLTGRKGLLYNLFAGGGSKDSGAGMSNPAKAAMLAAEGNQGSMFVGKSTQGESSTLMAALEGLQQFEGGGKINVISGRRSTAQQQALWDASVKAGHPGRMPNGNPIARPGTSDHELGNALDGQIMIGGKWVPLSALPSSVLAKFGLATVSGDVNHVQLGSGGGGGSTGGSGSGGPTAAQLAALGLGPSGPKTKKARKPGIVSGGGEIPAALAKQMAHAAEMAKATQGEAALQWVANEGDAIRAARASLKEKIKGQSGKQAAATQREIDALDKHLANLPTISGAHLLPQSLQDAISRFKTDALSSTGKAAAGYLNKEHGALEKAVAVLKGELVGAKGKQAAEIRKELNGIDSQVASVNKQITANLRAQAQAIKSNASSSISAAKQGISQAFSQIISDADQAFQNATNAYVTNTLGPEFYQGITNPLEAQLAAMQAEDTSTSLQDALAAAKQQLATDLSSGADAATIKGDKKGVSQAQRAIDENNLAIEATKLRAQEDADYAAALKQWTDARDLEEKRMNTALEDLGKAIGNGKATLDGKGGLTETLGKFGLAAGVVADDDMAALGLATATLAKVFADEAAALKGVGGTAAQKAANAALKEAQNLGGGGSGSSGAWNFPTHHPPQLASGGDIASDGLAYLHRGERVLPASVVGSPSGGGSPITIQLFAPNYVGDKRDLAAAIKSPQVQEAVATAVILASRGGHIRQGDIRP